MGLKRRDFLILGGLSGVGLAFVGKSWSSQNSVPAKPVMSEPPKAAGKDLLLRFVAVADTGAGDRNQYDVAKAMEQYYSQYPFKLVTLAGDNIYTNGEMSKINTVFAEPYAKLLKNGIKFRAALGNHDIRYENGDRQVEYPDFNMQGRYYTFTENSVQFFVIDTNTNADWKAQLPWLEKSLSESKAAWKIVYGHHQIYSSGVYNTDQDAVARLSPVFKKYGVQLYINGHEHSYERTKPIDGTTYLITGIGGAHLRRVGTSEWTGYSVSRFGFSALEVYPDRIEIQGIGTDGKVFDRGQVLLT
jgi:Calcineurin-like phosphoesterase